METSLKKSQTLISESADYSPEALEIYASIGSVIQGYGDREWVIGHLREATALVVRLGIQIDAELLKSAPNLRVIISPTTGLDHIEVEAAHSRGVEVLSLKGETEFLKGVPATAELSWGLLLGLIRQIPFAFQDVCGGGWNRDSFRGHDLRGRTLGIVGLGRIGCMMAAFAHSFGMRVIAFDPHPECVPPNVELVDFNHVLRGSDVVTVHVPLQAETRGLISDDQFQLMKKDALLINTSRGGIVDEQALLEALESGRVAGAAVDVLEMEQLQRCDGETSRALIEYARAHQNLLITPHIGGASIDSMAQTEIYMAKKCAAYFRNQRNGEGI